MMGNICDGERINIMEEQKVGEKQKKKKKRKKIPK